MIKTVISLVFQCAAFEKKASFILFGVSAGIFCPASETGFLKQQQTSSQTVNEPSMRIKALPLNIR